MNVCVLEALTVNAGIRAPLNMSVSFITADGPVHADAELVIVCETVRAALEFGQPEIPVPHIARETLEVLLRLLRDEAAALPASDSAVFALAAAANFLDAPCLGIIIKKIAAEIKLCFQSVNEHHYPMGGGLGARQVCKRFGLEYCEQGYESEGESSESEGEEESCVTGVLSELLGSDDLLDACLAELEPWRLRELKRANFELRAGVRRVRASLDWQARNLSVVEMLERRCSRGALLKRLEGHPGEAGMTVPHLEEDHSDKEDSDDDETDEQRARRRQYRRRLPLHEAIYLKSPSDIVLSLIEAYPDAARVTSPSHQQVGCWGRPLHMAVDGGSASDVIAALIAADPESATSRGPSGLTPLLMAPSAEVAEAILRQAPTAAARKSPYMEPPIFEACRLQKPVELVAVLLKYNPETCRGVEEKGDVQTLPLHEALGASKWRDRIDRSSGPKSGSWTPHGHAQVVRMLLDKYPQAACARAEVGGYSYASHTSASVAGGLPLHFALHSQCPAAVIIALIDCYPDAVTAAPHRMLYQVREHSSTLAMAISKAAADSVLLRLLEMQVELVDGRPFEGQPNALYAPLPTSPAAPVLRAHTSRLRIRRRSYPVECSFFALEKSATAAVIAAVIRANPSAAASRNAQGQNPLHYLLSRTQRPKDAYGRETGYDTAGDFLAVVNVVLLASTDAAKARDGEGLLPLQVALSNAGSLVYNTQRWQRSDPPEKAGIIRALLEAHPEATRVEPLALHTALGKLDDEMLIDAILAAYPGAVEHADTNGMLPFHLALLRISSRNPTSLALSLLKAGPAAAAVKFPTCANPAAPSQPAYHSNYQDEETRREKKRAAYSGYAPLVVALCEEAPAALIDLLVQQHPQALRVPCSVPSALPPHLRAVASMSCDGLPLHVALAISRGSSSVITLVEAWPEACQERNKSGMLPLEMALRNSCLAHQPDASVVLAVLRGWPQAASQPLQRDAETAPKLANSGWLTPPHIGYPLHLAAATGATAAMEAILKAWPAAAADVDDQSKLPLHILLEPEVVPGRSALWCTPTREAAWAHVPRVVQLLIDAAPKPTPPLPLHLVLSHEQTSPMDPCTVPPRVHRQLISDLFRRSPEAARVPMDGNHDNGYPVHRALQLRAPAGQLAQRISVPAGSLPGEQFSTRIDGVDTVISVPPEWKEGMELLVGMTGGSQDAMVDLVPDELVVAMYESYPQAALHHSFLCRGGVLQLAIRRNRPCPALIRTLLQAQPAAVKAIELREVIAAGLGDDILALLLAADLSAMPGSVDVREAGPCVSESKHFVAAVFEPKLRGAIRLLLADHEAVPGGLGLGRHAHSLLCAAVPSAKDFLAHIVSPPTASAAATASTTTDAGPLRRSKRLRD